MKNSLQSFEILPPFFFPHGGNVNSFSPEGRLGRGHFILISRSFAQFNLSSAEYCHGAPLFSILLKTALSSPGAEASSITRYLRISTINVGWFILIGHSIAHALHVVQAQS